MELDDISIHTRLLRVREGKSAAAKRTLKLRTESVSIVAHLVARSSGAFLFSADRNPLGKLSLSTCENWHNKTVKASGVLCVIHDMRHTFASRAANAGMPLATLAKILGHGSMRSVMKYVHPDQNEIDRAMDALDAG